MRKSILLVMLALVLVVAGCVQTKSDVKEKDTPNKRRHNRSIAS